MWMNISESDRTYLEKTRPAWVSSDDILDGKGSYIDPDEYYNPYRGW